MKKKRPDNTRKALERWSNEGGAPASGDASTREPKKRPRDPSAVGLGRKGGEARAKGLGLKAPLKESAAQAKAKSARKRARGR